MQSGLRDEKFGRVGGVELLEYDEARRWWADPWADRVRHSSYRTTALEQGLADDAELEAIAAAWHAWAAHPDGFFLCPHGELIAVK